MRKVRVNITIDEDLSQFLRGFSLSQRLSMSELINRLALSLKRAQENEGMNIVLSAPEFYQSLLNTLEKARSGNIKWRPREEVFYVNETYSDDFVQSVKKFSAIKKRILNKIDSP